MLLEALLFVVMRLDEVLDCEALSGKDVLLVEYEVRVFCTSGVGVVTEPAFGDSLEVV